MTSFAEQVRKQIGWHERGYNFQLYMFTRECHEWAEVYTRTYHELTDELTTECVIRILCENRLQYKNGAFVERDELRGKIVTLICPNALNLLWRIQNSARYSMIGCSQTEYTAIKDATFLSHRACDKAIKEFHVKDSSADPHFCVEIASWLPIYSLPPMGMDRWEKLIGSYTRDWKDDIRLTVHSMTCLPVSIFLQREKFQSVTNFVGMENKPGSISYAAIIHNRFTYVKKCIDRGVPLTPKMLHLALQNGREQIALALIDAGVPIDVVDDRGQMPIQAATESRLTKVALELLKRGANPKAPICRESLLHIAARDSCPELVDAFLKAGLDPNEAEPIEHKTPLHYALIPIFMDRRQQRLEVVKLLVAAGASTTLKDTYDQTPLDLARGLEKKEPLLVQAMLYSQ